MINNKIDEMIASALKNRETDLLNVLKLIKTEFVNAMHNKVELNEANEVKILLKMASQREDYTLSMKDMKPIMTLVKEKYPNANGKIISITLNKVINNK